MAAKINKGEYFVDCEQMDESKASHFCHFKPENLKILPAAVSSFTKGTDVVTNINAIVTYIKDGQNCSFNVGWPKTPIFGFNLTYPYGFTADPETGSPERATGMQVQQRFTSKDTVKKPTIAEERGLFIRNLLTDLGKTAYEFEASKPDEQCIIPGPSQSAFAMVAKKGWNFALKPLMAPGYKTDAKGQVIKDAANKKIVDPDSPLRNYVKFMTKGGNDPENPLQVKTIVCDDKGTRIDPLNYIGDKGKGTAKLITCFEHLRFGGYGTASYGAGFSEKVVNCKFTASEGAKPVSNFLTFDDDDVNTPPPRTEQGNFEASGFDSGIGDGEGEPDSHQEADQEPEIVPEPVVEPPKPAAKAPAAKTPAKAPAAKVAAKKPAAKK